MFAAKNELFSPSQGYQISRSVRLRSSASAYFSRSAYPVASAGTQWTMSMWVKRGTIGTQTDLFTFVSTTGSAQQAGIQFDSNNAIRWWQYAPSSYQFQKITTAVFRDPSAWYHLVFLYDTTLATAEDRCQVWINGVRQTSFSTNTNPSQNLVTYYKTGGLYPYIGAENRNASSALTTFDGYLTEINFIDGQALTPTSFGQFNSVTGVWQPIKYAGTYGTNGFYLNFSDNSAATAATIGKDYSGNGNNWTPNNISVTSGSTYDSMLDVPTPYADGGNGRGNYCVLNPLSANQMAGGTVSITNGNLTASDGATSYGVAAQGTIAVTSGKWYWEVTATTVGGNYGACGIRLSTLNGTDGAGYFYFSDGTKVTTVYGNGAAAYGASYTSGDVIGVALDMDAGTITFYKNNTSQGTAYTGLSGSFNACVGDGQNATQYVWNANFGQRPFTYTPPSGFNALNTQNLPAPTISNGALYMAATTFDGVTGGGTVTNTVNGVSFKPDFVWMKVRNNANNHELADSVRGTPYALFSNLTNAEVSDTRVSAFNSNGFSYGTNSNSALTGRTVVGWQWQAGAGTTSSNTSGSITSTVSVNATAGFSIVTYTGTGANATVGHGLGVAPSMIIIKCRGSATDPSWIVGHTGIVMGTGRLILNGTDANSNAGASVLWNSTAATSTVFSLGNYSSVNQSTLTYVAYCFSAVRGYSAFGSYTGNGSTDGPFVFTNFRPRFIMVKRTDTTGNWCLFDSSRLGYNGPSASKELYPNLSNAEGTSNGPDQLSNGFKFRDNYADVNASGGTYVYAAFAENPLKIALAR